MTAYDTTESAPRIVHPTPQVGSPRFIFLRRVSVGATRVDGHRKFDAPLKRVFMDWREAIGTSFWRSGFIVIGGFHFVKCLEIWDFASLTWCLSTALVYFSA